MNDQPSPQSVAIYQALSRKKYITARELGTKLGILPQAAYRAIKPLEKLGVVQQSGKYPRKYRIQASEASLDSYLLSVQEHYIKTFLAKSNTKNQIFKQLEVAFIQNREELTNKHCKDILQAKKRVDHIVSGEEVSAEMMLARKTAIENGVKLRFIVQQVNEFKKYMFSNWKKLGIEVKYFPLLEARIIIVDSRIVYMTSYNPKANNEAVGVRFDYPPIAKLMSELFEKRWVQSKDV
jgi:sugar-specific transcriptional regulator TrmB